MIAVKIIAVDKGFYVPGGTQLYGKFLTLKACMKACALAPSCFSADYNPWLRKCYQHSNYTACNTRKSHSQFVHFSKVPCSKFVSVRFLQCGSTPPPARFCGLLFLTVGNFKSFLHTYYTLLYTIDYKFFVQLSPSLTKLCNTIGETTHQIFTFH